MSYKNICVAGGGVLGSQIAFQAAYCGFDVTIWLRSESSIGRTQPKIDHVREEYIAAIEGMADGTGEWCAGIADSDQPFDKETALAAVERAYSTLKLELDLAKAVADAAATVGAQAPLLWLGAVAVGALVPLVCCVMARKKGDAASWKLFGGAAVVAGLIGAVCLRVAFYNVGLSVFMFY